MGLISTKKQILPIKITFDELFVDIINSKYMVAITGAGVSAESGIPTFRNGDDSIWKRYDIATYGTIQGFLKKPETLWTLIGDFLNEYNIRPNDGHIALFELENLNYLKCIITQNVDGLHQDAGSKNVIEYHGTVFSATCRLCSRRISYNKYNYIDVFAGPLPPICHCGGVYKPDLVLFGEQINFDVLKKANEEIDKCDLLLLIGTSCSTEPAAELVRRARRNKACIIEINNVFIDRIHPVDKIIIGKASLLRMTIKSLNSSTNSTDAFASTQMNKTSQR